MNIGENIKKYRTLNNLGQEEFAPQKDFDNGYAEIIGKVIDVSFDPNDMLRYQYEI